MKKQVKFKLGQVINHKHNGHFRVITAVTQFINGENYYHWTDEMGFKGSCGASQLLSWPYKN